MNEVNFIGIPPKVVRLSMLYFKIVFFIKLNQEILLEGIQPPTSLLDYRFRARK
jgi:hypothetical protein